MNSLGPEMGKFDNDEKNRGMPFFLGIITHNPPVVWAKITLPTRDLKSVT